MKKILLHVVEDDLEQADTLVHFLEKDGRFDVVFSETAHEALERHANDITPALVLCDINLEEDNKGYTVVSDCHRRNIPAIVITGRSDRDQERASAAIHGAVSYLPKPYASQVLLATIENILQTTGQLKDHIDISPRLSYDPEERDLFLDEKVVHTWGELQGKVFALLGQNLEGYTSPDILARELYGEVDSYARENTYQVLRGMRQAIEKNNIPLTIAAAGGRRSKGYKITLLEEPDGDS
ncbi:MAG: response regulator [Chloroflexi bacterium]|nr:MAG: response regulator [Chloroflexota bacterium]